MGRRRKRGASKWKQTMKKTYISPAIQIEETSPIDELLVTSSVTLDDSENKMLDDSEDILVKESFTISGDDEW